MIKTHQPAPSRAGSLFYVYTGEGTGYILLYVYTGEETGYILFYVYTGEGRGYIPLSPPYTVDSRKI